MRASHRSGCEYPDSFTCIQVSLEPPWSSILLFVPPAQKFILRLENHQPGETATFVKLQHDREIPQQLARQFPDKMAVRRHLSTFVLAQLHRDQVRVEANFNSAFLQPDRKSVL